MESDDSLALTSVDHVLDSLSYLKGQFGGNVHVVESVDSLNKIPFGQGSHLVLVQLPEDHELMLSARLADDGESNFSVVIFLCTLTQTHTYTLSKSN